MQAIRAGDLYFLESPFHADIEHGSKVEKRLSYLLGTVSSRPAVVIRAPEWWDQFNTCTVIPALSKGDPACVFHFNDRYGYRTAYDYPFVPHNPHTIPVSRLGRYIGSLDHEELEELLYAFKWIHDPLMRRDNTLAIPAVYQNVMAKEVPPKSWKVNRDARSDVVLRIKKEDDANGLKIVSETNPEVSGFPISKMINDRMTDETRRAVEEEPDYIPAQTPLPDSVPTAVNEIAVPVEKDFPESIFSKDVLTRVAGRFTISDAYYNNDKTIRNPDVLTKEEADEIRGEQSMFTFNTLVEYYKKLTPLDAYILGPRLPLTVLAEITELDRESAVILKKMCNIMRDMSDEEYDQRISAHVATRCRQIVAERATDTSASSEDDITEKIKKLKPYLSAKKIETLPDELASILLDVPMYRLQKAWSGPQFKIMYKKVQDRCKRVVATAN